MERRKFFRGFLLGILCTLLVGGVGLKVYDSVQYRERNQGAVTDAFVQKAKFIEETVKDSYTGETEEPWNLAEDDPAHFVFLRLSNS